MPCKKRRKRMPNKEGQKKTKKNVVKGLHETRKKGSNSISI
jgi:hypothetical protein